MIILLTLKASTLATLLEAFKRIKVAQVKESPGREVYQIRLDLPRKVML